MNYSGMVGTPENIDRSEGNWLRNLGNHTLEELLHDHFLKTCPCSILLEPQYTSTRIHSRQVCTYNDFFDAKIPICVDQAHSNGVIFIIFMLIELDYSQPDGSSFFKSWIIIYLIEKD